MTSSTPQHPLSGLKLHSFSEILDKLPPLDMSKVQKLLKKQRERFPPLSHDEANHSQPLLLVSHDFKGNYRPSDFSTVCSSSTSVLCPHDECFTMELGWKACDIFNYFSHTRISIPPPEWTATCRNMNNENPHQRRKKIIGTIITEWDEGFRECNDYLLSPQTVDDRKLNQIILRLAALCVEHDFDGYLVNIENPVKDTTRMKKFVQLLNDTVVGMLGKDRGCAIWYDSVIFPSGQLRWQNTLNRNNSVFFESCSGIFTNYNWTENHAVDALEVLADLNNKNENENNAKAIKSSSSVFFGTDCFGRGTFLGGGHDSHKAVGVAMSLGLSAALFAPGWTMENFNHVALGKNNVSHQTGDDDGDWKSSRLSYLMTSTKFWRDVLQQIHDNSPAGARDELVSWNVGGRFSSSTSFCASAGCVFSVFGRNVQSTKWCQLSALEQQPSFKIPVVPSSSIHHHHQATSFSSSPIQLLEHFSIQDAQKYGSFWGNRSLVVNINSNNSSRVEFCAVKTSSKSITIELVVSKSTLQELNSRMLSLCVSSSSSTSGSLFTIIDQTFDNDTKNIFLGQNNFSVLSCDLELTSNKNDSDIIPLFLSTVTKTNQDEDAPPALSAESSLIQVQIGLIRIQATSENAEKLFSTMQLNIISSPNADKKPSSLLFSVCRRQRNEDEKGAREVLQISATEELMTTMNVVSKDVERISLLGRQGSEFYGNVFVAGVWLKCEIDHQELLIDAMVVRYRNGSIKYCAL